MSSETELVTMREAARRLGLGDSRSAERRLRRRVLQVERSTGRTLIIPGAVARAPCITVAAIRSACAEFKASRVEDMVRLAKEQVEQMVEREVGSQITERIEPRLRELWIRDEKIAETMIQALRRLERVEKAVRIPADSGRFGIERHELGETG